MGKTGWQTLAFFAIAWAVAASAIAWINKGQIEHRTAPEDNSAELAELREIIGGLQRHNESLTATLQAYEDELAPSVDLAGSRCINGTRFRTVGGVLQNIGRCPKLSGK